MSDSPWRPISTAPEKIDVLVYDPYLGQRVIARRIGHWWSACRDVNPQVWTPLPDAPKTRKGRIVSEHPATVEAKKEADL